MSSALWCRREEMSVIYWPFISASSLWRPNVRAELQVEALQCRCFYWCARSHGSLMSAVEKHNNTLKLTFQTVNWLIYPERQLQTLNQGYYKQTISRQSGVRRQLCVQCWNVTKHINSRIWAQIWGICTLLECFLVIQHIGWCYCAFNCKLFYKLRLAQKNCMNSL